MATTTTATAEFDFKGWVSLAEAASRLPSPRPGKKTHVSTVYRLAVKHGLEVMRRGPWRFVRWADLAALLIPVEPGQAVPRSTPRGRTSRVPKWVVDDLKRRGLWKPEE